jgi:hypothetical protein
METCIALPDEAIGQAMHEVKKAIDALESWF